MTSAQIGDRFTVMGTTAEVVKVGRKYATLKVTQPHGASWTKRQPLPIPDSWERVQ